MVHSGELTETDYLRLKRRQIREDCDAAVGKAANAYRQTLLRTLDKRLEKPGKGE